MDHSQNCPNIQLCELAQTKFYELEKRWEVRYMALADSIDKAERLLMIRLEEMGNFRKQIEAERQSYTTRRETVLLNFIISLTIVFTAAVVTHLIGK